MSINCHQLKVYVVEPTLKAIGLYSESAVALILGTCAQESNMGRYLHQIGGGSALGIYQMESPTYNDIWLNTVETNKALKAKILLYTGYNGKPPPIRLISDMALATIMTRLHYKRVPSPLPEAKDVDGLAYYWKNHYNTHLGKGTVDEFKHNFRSLVTTHT